MTATPHLVALDVDGTTINHAGEMSPAVHDAVRAVADAGHHVTIATGRSILATMPILAELGIETGYAVCSNGAVTLRLDPGSRRRLRDHRGRDVRPAHRPSTCCAASGPTPSSRWRSSASASR